MDRIALTRFFHAEAVDIPWMQLLRAQPGISRGRAQQSIPDAVRLTWGCSAPLGVPHAPFTVWTRRGGREDARPVPVTTTPADGGGLRLDWGGIEAGRVAVECTPDDITKPVALLLYRDEGREMAALTGARSRRVFDDDPLVLDVRVAAAAVAVLVNATPSQVSIVPLRDIVNADDWEELERVGLPVPDVWNGTDYDTGAQGMVAASQSPVDAAVTRVRRAGPPIGWDPVAPVLGAVPTWSPPDPDLVVGRLTTDLVPAIAALYAPGSPEIGQAQISAQAKVDTPASPQPVVADDKPWTRLALTAHVDPFHNLATGFGTGYPRGEGEGEFLVTAPYRSVAGWPIEAVVAAYAPRGLTLNARPTVSQVTAARAGLLLPAGATAEWGESIHIGFPRHRGTAALGVQTQQAAAVSESGAPAAMLVHKDEDVGGWRALAISPDTGKDADPNRATFAHGRVLIPLRSGGRRAVYAVATSDVYGVWTPWATTAYAGDEPLAQPPRIVSLKVDTHYQDSPSCPATLTCDLAVEWTERAPSAVHVQVQLVPRPDPHAPLPALAPDSPIPPAGTVVFDATIGFTGDDPSMAVGTVVELAPDSEKQRQAGTARDDHPRRYRLTATLPAIDFSVWPRWDAVAWALREVTAGPSPSPWSPSMHAALASPVPPPAPLPEKLPGVPLASIPDAARVSHARVSWTPPGGEVRRAVVWECSETALHQRAQLDLNAEPDLSPGGRLKALWDAYDALPVPARRRSFRRIGEYAQEDGAADVELPRGSRDIHLFIVTFVTSTGIESPWPTERGQTCLRAVIAPLVLQPSPPRLRTEVTATGIAVVIEADSDTPVSHFLLLKTRKQTAALRAASMGPGTVIAAAPVPDPDDSAKLRVDAATGRPLYRGDAVLTLEPAWSPWLLRAITVPAEPDPATAVRAIHSPACDVVPITVVPGDPPWLDGLIVQTLDDTGTRFVVQTVSRAPLRSALGDHLVQARITGIAGDPVQVGPVALGAIPESAGDVPPTTPQAWTRRPRVGVDSLLQLWLVRPDPHVETLVEVSITDPRGLRTTVTTTIAAVATPAQPPPMPSLRVTERFRVSGGGVVTVATDANATAGFRLEIAASRRRPRPPRHGDPPPWGQIDDAMHASIALAAIPVGIGQAPATGSIAIVRDPDAAVPNTYSILVPMAKPAFVSIALVHPDGRRVSVSATV